MTCLRQLPVLLSCSCNIRFNESLLLDVKIGYSGGCDGEDETGETAPAVTMVAASLAVAITITRS